MAALIKGILMFLVVAGATTTAAVITTMQDKAQEDKIDSITTMESTTKADKTCNFLLFLKTVKLKSPIPFRCGSHHWKLDIS